MVFVEHLLCWEVLKEERWVKGSATEKKLRGRKICMYTIRMRGGMGRRVCIQCSMYIVSNVLQGAKPLGKLK